MNIFKWLDPYSTQGRFSTFFHFENHHFWIKILNLHQFHSRVQETGGLHRCWWRMLETKCVDDNSGMLVTDLLDYFTVIFKIGVQFGSNLLLLFAAGRNDRTEIRIYTVLIRGSFVESLHSNKSSRFWYWTWSEDLEWKIWRP